jgi:lantibiotic modifying enzyme
LTEFAAATAHSHALDVAQGVADLLLSEARPDPDCGWNWREHLHDEAMRVQSQCHGAIGIGQFFLRLQRVAPRDTYVRAAREAASTAVREMRRRVSPCLCHGLVGDGNLLLDCYEVLGDAQFADGAQDCATRLLEFRDAQRPGAYRSWLTKISRPDLLVGDAGIGWFFLRLARTVPIGDPVLC